jgi:DNA-binding MarR family transcriptional regulator
MAKKKAVKKASQKRLPKLTPLASQIVLYLINNLAIGDYDRCCAIEDIARHLGKTEGRVKKLVEQLVEQGYLQLEGGILDTAYPTVAAIQQQDPSTSAETARTLIRKAKG